MYALECTSAGCAHIAYHTCVFCSRSVCQVHSRRIDNGVICLDCRRKSPWRRLNDWLARNLKAAPQA